MDSERFHLIQSQMRNRKAETQRHPPPPPQSKNRLLLTSKSQKDALKEKKNQTASKLQDKFITFPPAPHSVSTSTPKQIIISVMDWWRWKCLHGRCHHGSSQIIYISKAEDNTLLFNIRTEESAGLNLSVVLRTHHSNG